jgi:hypothetical protein
LVAPEACPACVGRTDAITALATGAMKAAVPIPASTSAGTSCA